MAGRLQLFCVWSGLAFLVLYGAFFLGVAGFIPPSPPSWSEADVAGFYTENRYEIRVGQVGALVMSTLLFPFWAVITGYIARIEARQGRLPLLALMQFAGAVLLQVFFVLCSMLWIIATFRPEYDAATIRTLHDAGWLIFVMVFPAFTMQMFSIAVASFIDDSPNPAWPRWVGYLNLWVGLAGTGGGIAVFFYSGAFAWNGLIGFWIPVLVFVIWIVIMTMLMHKDSKRAAADQVPARPESAFAG